MMNDSSAMAWRVGGGLIVLLGSLLPLWAVAAPAPDQQIATFHAPRVIPSSQMSEPVLESRIRERVVAARHVLMQLQVFVEEATRTIELGDQLKSRRLENNRLRMTLLSSRAAKKAFENHGPPAQIVTSALTKTIVRNWLTTVRLEDRFDAARRDLVTSKDSWLELERRVATLKQALAKRRSELHALRAKRTALGIELGRLRRQLATTEADARLFEGQEERLLAATQTLRRNVTSKLRSMLLH